MSTLTLTRAVPIERRLGLVAAALAVACGPPAGEDLYHVRSAGMALPVVERGQRDAPFAVVHVHGGPGESRLDTRLGAEIRLAESLLYVTWAQRTTAFATGNLRRETANLAQHVRDLEAVLAAVHRRHPDKSVVLTGFSWGGAMVIEYLADRPAPYVAGFVLIGALVDARRAIDDSWAMLRAHAERRVANGASNAAYWRTVIDRADAYAGALDTLAPKDYLERFVRPRTTACRRMREDLGLPDNVENERKNVYDRYQLLPPVEGVAVEWMVEEILDVTLVSRLPSISRPAMVLWGELDCNSPLPSGEAAFADLATPASQKILRVLAGIPHDVLDSAPAEYAQAVRDLIDVISQ